VASKNNNEKRVTILVDKDLDYEFRRLASRKFKFATKWYSKAMEEAIHLWIAENPEESLDENN
jgi:hypothetical protein